MHDPEDGPVAGRDGQNVGDGRDNTPLPVLVADRYEWEWVRVLHRQAVLFRIGDPRCECVVYVLQELFKRGLERELRMRAAAPAARRRCGRSRWHGPPSVSLFVSVQHRRAPHRERMRPFIGELQAEHVASPTVNGIAALGTGARGPAGPPAATLRRPFIWIRTRRARCKKMTRWSGTFGVSIAYVFQRST